MEALGRWLADAWHQTLRWTERKVCNVGNGINMADTFSALPHTINPSLLHLSLSTFSHHRLIKPADWPANLTHPWTHAAPGYSYYRRPIIYQTKQKTAATKKKKRWPPRRSLTTPTPTAPHTPPKTRLTHRTPRATTISWIPLT